MEDWQVSKGGGACGSAHEQLNCAAHQHLNTEHESCKQHWQLLDQQRHNHAQWCQQVQGKEQACQQHLLPQQPVRAPLQSRQVHRIRPEASQHVGMQPDYMHGAQRAQHAGVPTSQTLPMEQQQQCRGPTMGPIQHAEPYTRQQGQQWQQAWSQQQHPLTKPQEAALHQPKKVSCAIGWKSLTL